MNEDIALTKRRRRKLAFAGGSLVLITLVFSTLLARRPAISRKDYLSASPPVFSSRTDATGVQTILSFVVSNASPVSVGYWLPWSECRASKSLSPVATKLAAGSKSTCLRPGMATNVLMLVEGGLRNEKPIFCCQVTWAERESDLQGWLRKVDKPMYWLGAVLGFNWEPPWRRKGFAFGDVFTSNLEVANYFSQVHGLTRKLWVEEQRQEQERQARLARIRATLPPNQTIRFRPRTTLTERDQAELEAKAAFARFCNGVQGD